MQPRVAVAADLPRLLELVRAFWVVERLPLHEVDLPAVLGALLADPTRGRVWVMEHDGTFIAYAVLAFGYSLEHGGRDALVDELYVVPNERGHGWGTLLLQTLADTCREEGITRMHLEVDHTNPRAHALYMRLGFRGQDRQVLTRRLD